MKMLIAEIGTNHLGSIERLDKLTSAALRSKVDGVTIQIREDIYYLQPSKPVRLTNEEYAQWCQNIRKEDKKVGMAICEIDHIDIFDCDFYKILSKDYHNTPLVEAALNTGKPIYISTGGTELADLDKWSKYDNAHFIHTEFSPYTVDVNLKAIQTMKDRVGDRVSFGKHCQDMNVLPAAIAFEPEALWFYIRDDNDKQPDFLHAVQLEMLEVAAAILQDLKLALGDGLKITRMPRV